MKDSWEGRKGGTEGKDYDCVEIQYKQVRHLIIYQYNSKMFGNTTKKQNLLPTQKTSVQRW